MKAITRMMYLPEEYLPPSARYVELELTKNEQQRILVEWIRQAHRTEYAEPYHLFMANCYTDACSMLREIFTEKIKPGLLEGCKRILSHLPFGKSSELSHLKSIGAIGQGAAWKPLAIPKKPGG